MSPMEDVDAKRSKKRSSAIASVPPETPTQQAAGELKVKKTGKGLIEATTSSRALASSGPPK